MNQAIPPTTRCPRADDGRAVAMGRQVLEIEAAAVAALARRLDGEFSAAVALILDSRGRVVVSGIGKSGHIARKLAATFASTGTPAYFVHAAEAVHGDLGMITRDDVLIAISNSGENDELLTIVPLVKRLGGKLIAITGNPSSLAQAGRHPSRRPCRPGGLPAQPGTDRQHHGGAGPGRCAGRGPARCARLRCRRFRPLPSRRRARPQAC
jgi:DNA-binding MurR/RpiR family transcriptional regulator